MPAGEIPAIMAKPHKSFPQELALPFVVTILAAWQATDAVRLPKPLLPQVVLHRQVASAQATVHPAGSDQFFTHGFHTINIQGLGRQTPVR